MEDDWLPAWLALALLQIMQHNCALTNLEMNRRHHFYVGKCEACVFFYVYYQTEQSSISHSSASNCAFSVIYKQQAKPKHTHGRWDILLGVSE